MILALPIPVSAAGYFTTLNTDNDEQISASCGRGDSNAAEGCTENAVGE
mgnify:CR=1 FL=1